MNVWKKFVIGPDELTNDILFDQLLDQRLNPGVICWDLFALGAFQNDEIHFINLGRRASQADLGFVDYLNQPRTKL